MTFDALVAQYLACLQSEGRTPHTIRWHRQSLEQFGDWLREHGDPERPGAWTPTLLRSYIVFHQTRTSARGKPLSESALNSLIRSLRAFCNWLLEEELVERNLFQRVTVPKAPRLVQPTLSSEEILALLAAVLRGSRRPLRDEALLMFMLDTGARAREVCTLQASAIDWERGIARVLGKGRKERYVPFCPATAKALRKYAVRERRETCEEFFQSEEGHPLTTSGLSQICRRLSRLTGIHIAPHKCHHTFGVEYLRCGGSVFAQQKMLGHTALDTTLRYASLVTDDLIREHREHSLIGGLLNGRKG